MPIETTTHRQIWSHVRSGESFAVELDDAGRVVSACGPLHYSEIAAAFDDGFEADPDVTVDLRDAPDAEYELMSAETLADLRAHGGAGG